MTPLMPHVDDFAFLKHLPRVTTCFGCTMSPGILRMAFQSRDDVSEFKHVLGLERAYVHHFCIYRQLGTGLTGVGNTQGG